MVLPADQHIAWARLESARHRHRLSESGVDPPDLEAMGLPWRAPLHPAGYALQPELERALGGLWGMPGGRVLLTAGGSEANACVFGALLERGGEVLVEVPGYEPHREVPRLFDIATRRFPRPLGDSGALPAAVEAALRPETRMVVLTHLHNPSGLPLAGREALELQELAERRGFWILCDEIFRDAMPGPRSSYATLGPRWVVTSSLTKVYGLGGLRIGWIAGSEEVLARCATVQNALSAQPALPSIALALELVPHLDRLRARSHAMLEANHERWADLLAGGTPFAIPVASRGTTAWAIFPAAGQGDAFAAFASRHADLAVTPGGFFCDPRGIRVGLGGEPARVAQALATLQQTLTAFTAAEPIQETS